MRLRRRSARGVDPSCKHLCDNDGDGLVDLAVPGCEGDPARISEVDVPHCRDGQDNDGGFIDLPNDPG